MPHVTATPRSAVSTTAAAALPVRVVGQYGEVEGVLRPALVEWESACWLGNTVSKPKKSRLMMGTKNNRVSQSGWPASRSLFNVMVTPIQMNGSAAISRMEKNCLSVEESGENFAARSSGSK